MRRKEITVSLAILLTLGFFNVKPVQAETPQDAAYAAAYTATENALNTKTQKSINAARKAIAALHKAGLNWAVGEFSKQVDSVQHPILVKAVNAINNAKAYTSQANINAAKAAIDSDMPDEWKNSYSSAVDSIQQKLMKEAIDAYNKAAQSKGQADINAAQALISDIKTAADQSIVAWAKTLEEQVKSIITSEITSVVVKNSKELMENISSNKTVILKAGEYNLLEPKVLENKNIKYNEVFDGYEIIINNVSNFTIKAEEGAEVKLLVDPRYAYVLSFNNCKNINISGVIAGHYPEKGSCTGGVFKFTDCSDIQIDKSDLFGCGTEGLTLTNVNNLQFNNSTIRECSYGIMTIIDSKNIIFNNSTFKQNEEYNLINIVNSDIKVDKCIINNNRTASDWDNGMYLFSLDLYSKAIISNSTIKDNSVKKLDNGKGTITYENNIFSGNNFDVK